MSSRVNAIIAFVILLAAASVASCQAAAVTVDRILREHKVYVVSTETEAELSRYWLDWRPANVTIMPMTEFFLKQSRLDDGGFVIFIIDRSKAKRMIPEEEMLLPCATSGVESSEVVVYASKTGNKRSPARQNRWDVLISAPNDKWLHSELQRVGSSGMLTRAIDERGAVLDRYMVRRLSIVSTEGRQVAENWVKRQNSPGRDAIDWDFLPANTWTADSDSGVDLLFLLNKEAMAAAESASVAALPEGLRQWFAGVSSRDECAAEKQAAKSPSGQDRTVAAVVAPCARQLELFLDKYSSLAHIPEALARHRLTDLSPYARLAVVARPGDRTFSGQERILDDFAGKITSAMSSGAVGFQCESRQDLKELIYESLRNGEDNIDAAGVTAIRTKINGNYALAVADLAAVTVQTSYVANTPQCSSSPYPAFDRPKPSEPSRPSTSDRKYGIFGPKLYPEGEDDPKYIGRMRRYREEMRQYERDLERWDYEAREYEAKRHYHDMEWTVSIDSIQTAKITGNLRIYDLTTFGGATGGGEVVFSCPLSGSSERRSTLRADRVVVRGEDSRPDTPQAPESESALADQTVLSEAIQHACSAAIGQITTTAILPRDRVFVPEVINVAQTVEQRVETEAVGAIKLSKKPVGDGVEVAREAALANALLELVKNVRDACPGAQLTDDEIRTRAKPTSEGWDSKSGEYRVKIRFEGDVIAQLPAGEVKK